MIISIIAAIGRNGVMGKNGAMPWYLPNDLNHFKNLTVGKPIIMGRKTFESVGKPLPERLNIVLTGNDKYKALGCITAKNVKEALEIAEKSEEGKKTGEIMICGGAEIYKQFLPITTRMYLTIIDGDFEGDTFFPEFKETDWQEVSREIHKADDRNPYDCEFIVLERKV